MKQIVAPLLQEVVLWPALLVLVIAVGIYLLGKIRSKPAKQESTTSEMLSKFRELHSRGELSDAEYRTIKTTLAARLNRELNDNTDKG
jgi:uncharacterized membrane protein